MQQESKAGAATSETAPDAEIGAAVARLAGAAGGGRVDRREMRALAGTVVTKLGKASVLGGRRLTEIFLDVVPRIPVRDRETLRAHYRGLEGEELADALVTTAARATAAVGAGGGALAAVQFTAPPLYLTAPAQIAAETLLVAAIEVKLLAELHEVYGRPVRGTIGRRSTAYVMAWTNRRGIDPLDLLSMPLSVGTAAKIAVRRRLVRRAGRNITTLGPMLTGALAGSLLNHKETLRLAKEIRTELRAGSTLPG